MENQITIKFSTDRRLTEDQAYELITDLMFQVKNPIIRGIDKYKTSDVNGNFDNIFIDMYV